MWIEVEADVPKELAWQTEAVFSLEDQPELCQVGFMRPSLFGPPVLWFTFSGKSFRALRVAREALDQLQLMRKEPVVLAETNNPVSARFAEYLGFEFIREVYGRRQYKRSLRCSL